MLDKILASYAFLGGGVLVLQGDPGDGSLAQANHLLP